MNDIILKMIETDRIVLSELSKKVEYLDKDRKDQWKIISDLIKEIEVLKNANKNK